MVGAFIDKRQQWILYILLGVATIIAGFVIYPNFREAFGIASTGSSYNTGVIFGWILIVVVVLVAMFAAFGINPFKARENALPYNPSVTHSQVEGNNANPAH